MWEGTSMAVCERCGATADAETGSHCGYCGSALPRMAKLIQSEPTDPLAMAIEQAPHVRPHRMYVLTLEKPPGGEAVVNFWKIWTGFSAVLFVPFLCAFNIIPVWLMPLAFVILGVKQMKKAQQAMRDFLDAPLLRQAVRVVDERHSVPQGRRRAGTIVYHVTLETPDGERVECQTDAELIGLVTPGDVGVAFTRDVHLLDFVRVG